MTRTKPEWLSLTDDQFSEADKILKVCVPNAEVSAFGSRVGGKKHRPQADLDLLVDNGKPLTLSELAELKNMFESSGLPMRVDIIDRYEAGENFLALIEKDSCSWP